jgi:hypothetical protein
MSSRHLHLKLIVLAVSLVYSNISKADGNNFLPLTPRAFLWGTTGDVTNGRLDAMIPLFGSSDGMVYTDLQGQYGSDKSFSESLGLGVRQALNNNLLLGVYGFIDRLQTVDEANFASKWTVFNPGIEFMTNNWDGRINGYFPIGPDTRTVSQQTLFGDQLNGVPFVETFQGHTQDDDLFLVSTLNEIPKGVDADVGYTFLNMNRVRVHGGGYYFSYPQTSNMTGAEAGVEIPVNKYIALEFNDSYDNLLHNTALVSVRFTLGGITKSNIHPTIQDRMLDPIQRHLGTLSSNSGVPERSFVNPVLLGNRMERNNIWYFNANSGATFNSAAGSDNCTFEHPCIGTDFNQANIQTINGISSNADFFFTPGTYNFSNRLSLYMGQSMFGRNGDYSLPASPASGFPTFIGGLDPQGNNTLDSFALINGSSNESNGVFIQNTASARVQMNNLQVSGFDYAIKLENATNVTLQKSTIDALVVGLFADNHSSVVADDENVFYVQSANSSIGGVAADDASQVTFNDNKVYVNSYSGPGEAFGIFASSGASVNASHNIFGINLSPPSPLKPIPQGNSLDSYGILNTGGTVNAESNQYTVNANNPASGLAIGTWTANGGTTTLTNNTFNINAVAITGGNSVGIVNSNNSTTTATSNEFNLTSGSNSNITGILNDFLGTVVANDNTFLTVGAAAAKNCKLGNIVGISGTGNTFDGNPC